MITNLMLLSLPLAPFVVAWGVVRYGPIRNRWWRGENPLGFAALVGAIAFFAGFFGGMIVFPKSNLGPLAGVVYLAPTGFALGLIWGLWRAFRRGKWQSGPAS